MGFFFLFAFVFVVVPYPTGLLLMYYGFIFYVFRGFLSVMSTCVSVYTCYFCFLFDSFSVHLFALSYYGLLVFSLSYFINTPFSSFIISLLLL